ncbi:vasculin isoform X1 [Heliangelus exortis]|uniref:vasculin isoform X1 n=1 Tax=Heliangelus exortis TaxID=472823 RepID=UPI003A916F60
MAHHDFAPAWLYFPALPSSTKLSLNFKKHSENLLLTENCYEANHRRYNYADGFDAGIGRPNGGHFARKEKHGWRSQGRSGTKNINHRGGCHGGPFRNRTSTFHWGKGRGLPENSILDNGTGKKEGEVPRHFKAEDFPSLNPKYEREPNRIESSAASVWAYPLNPKSRSLRMLVLRKGSTKELQMSRCLVVGGLHSQTVRKGTGTNVHKGSVPKPVILPAKPTQWKSEAKDNKLRNLFPCESAYGVGNFSPFKSTAKAHGQSQNSKKECSQSHSSSPVGKAGQPHLLTRIWTNKKREFLKTLKQDRMEEKHEDKNRAGKEKNDASFNLNKSNSPHRERDISQNTESEIPQENGNTSIKSQQIIQSSAFPQADVLSSSLEAEHRLLKAMGWQEYSENDEMCAPLTEEEMREFRVIRDQLQKNGLWKTGILKKGLISGFRFSPWKNSTFKPTQEEDSETSSSDTSDDEDI